MANLWCQLDEANILITHIKSRPFGQSRGRARACTFQPSMPLPLPLPCPILRRLNTDGHCADTDTDTDTETLPQSVRHRPTDARHTARNHGWCDGAHCSQQQQQRAVGRMGEDALDEAASRAITITLHVQWCCVMRARVHVAWRITSVSATFYVRYTIQLSFWFNWITSCPQPADCGPHKTLLFYSILYMYSAVRCLHIL